MRINEFRSDYFDDTYMVGLLKFVIGVFEDYKEDEVLNLVQVTAHKPPPRSGSPYGTMTVTLSAVQALFEVYVDSPSEYHIVSYITDKFNANVALVKKWSHDSNQLINPKHIPNIMKYLYLLHKEEYYVKKAEVADSTNYRVVIKTQTGSGS